MPESQQTPTPAVKNLNILPLVSLGILWALLIYQLQVTWSVNPQYSYGYLVPALCIFMLWRQGYKNKIEPDLNPNPAKKFFCYSVIALGALAIFPLWLIREANSDWRLLNWAFAFNVLAISYAWIYKGIKLKSLIHYFYPTLFFLVAVPWPLAWDAELTLYLQEQVSIYVTEFLWFIGYPVQLQGSIIVMPSGPVSSVDEACSGIRGLQSSIVVALFLGFYYNFPLWLRFPFVGIGIIIAFVINLIRAFILTYIGVVNGTEAISSWHDPAGYTESIGIFIVLFCMALLFSKLLEHNPDDEFEGNWKLFELKEKKSLSYPIIAWLVICVIFNFAWYHYKEKELKDTPSIKIVYPTDIESFESHPISDTIRSQLHYSEAESVTWIDPKTDAHMQGFYSRWKTGDGSPSILAIHSPDQCLGSRGLLLKEKFPVFHVKHLGYNITVEAYTFTLGPRELHVFRCIWPDKSLTTQLPGFPKSGYDLRGRVKAAWDGKRNTGNRLIVFAIKETNDYETAKGIAIRQFKESIQELKDS